MSAAIECVSQKEVPQNDSEKSIIVRKTSKFPFEVFVLSESGKPIYSWNRREDVITLLPVCQVLVNFFHDTQCDTLRYITTKNGLKITFCAKTPLIIVVVSHYLSGIDPQLVINQVHAQITSIVTAPTLKNVFEQSPTYDLRKLLTGSEKLIDFLIEEGLMVFTSPRELNAVDCFLSSGVASISNHSRSNNTVVSNSTPSFFHPKQRSHIRAMIPVLTLNPSVRDSISNFVSSSVLANSSNILFSLLVDTQCAVSDSEDYSNTSKHPITKLITVLNHNPRLNKISPTDLQLLQTLIIASDNQLRSADSLWLPICLPRFDSTAFMHAHISYLNQNVQSVNKNICLVLLTTNREDFHKCQLVKESVRQRLNKIQLASPSFSDLTIPHLQLFWYQSIRSQSILYRVSPEVSVTEFNSLIHFVAQRMLTSKLKTFWFRSDEQRVTLLGWHSPSFQLYIQFDVTVTQSSCLCAAQSIIKWIKNEETKLMLKEYQ